MKKLNSIQFYGMPLPIYAFFAIIVLACAYFNIIPNQMIGAVAVLFAFGILIGEIGERLPIWNKFLGGGAMLCFLAAGLLKYFNLLPECVTNVSDGWINGYSFLNVFITFLVVGSLLGIDRDVLIKSGSLYIPTLLCSLLGACVFGVVAGLIFGNDPLYLITSYVLPIMGGGMGAGAVPLSKIFESSGTMTAAEAISIMTPAVAIGNAISIVLGGILVKVIHSKELNGQGKLMRSADAADELGVSEEMQAKRDHIDVRNMGIGMFISCSFFAWGYIVAKIWDTLVPSISIHAYAWMIISVAVCKIFNIIPEDIEVDCYQWFQFIMKNLTPALLVGIGLCYLELGTVISSFSLTYLVLCFLSCIGAFLGAALVGRLVGFYPVEAGVTAGLCMSNMGGTGDVAVLSAADRMELMPFAQISSRLGGAIIMVVGSLLLSVLGSLL